MQGTNCSKERVALGRASKQASNQPTMVAERAFALDVSEAVSAGGLEADFQALSELLRSIALHTTLALDSTHFGLTEIFRWIALITAV